LTLFAVDYKTFLTILNRPDGFKPAGTPGNSLFKEKRVTLKKKKNVFAEEFIRGFQVFDKEGNGFIGAGELRYVLTQLGEKMSDEEVDELLKGVQIGACVFSSSSALYTSLTRVQRWKRELRVICTHYPQSVTGSTRACPVHVLA
jgi:hypothetical protein